MREYEVRLIKNNGTASLVAIQRYFSDFAAIRAAQAMGKAGESIEVCGTMFACTSGRDEPI
jgi:hypothetical protein